MPIHLSIVIPSYNVSQDYKGNELESVRKYLSTKNFGWEVILVDDGSSDNTFNILSKYCNEHKGFRVTRIEHGGKVAAVSEGVKNAEGEIILFTDFDQSTPISEFDKFDKYFNDGYQIVIAKRDRQKENDTLISKLRSKLFNYLVQLIILPGVSDTQCGFKAFTKNEAKYLFKNLKVCKPQKIKNSYMGAFDVEILFIAKLKRFKIKSVNVTWKREDSKNLKLSEPLKMLIEIIRIRVYYLYHRI